MNEKLKKLEELLRGDANPKWELTLDILKAIAKAINKSDKEEKDEKDTIDDISDKVFDKFDKLFKDAQNMISSYFKKDE